MNPTACRYCGLFFCVDSLNNKQKLWSAAGTAAWIAYLLLISTFLAFTVATTAQELNNHTFFYHRHSDSSGGMHTNDFVMDYAMGKLASAQPREKIYDENVQFRYWRNTLLSQVGISPSDKLGQTFYCPNPPQFVLWCLPFSKLPIDQAYVVRIVLTVLIGITAVVYLARACGNWSAAAAITASWLALGSIAGCQSIHMSVSGGWLMLAFICVYLAALLQGKDVLSGVALCLAAYKVQYAPFLLMPALAMKKWRIIATAAVSEIALLLSSGIILGFDNLLDYPRALFSGEQSKSVTSVNPQFMIDLRGVLTPYMAQKVLIPLCLMVMIPALIWVFHLCRRAYCSRNAEALRFSLAVMLLTAVSAGAHNHMPDCIFFLALAALTVPPLRLPGWYQSGSRNRRLWCFLWTFYPILTWLIFLCSTERNACITLWIVNLLLLALAVSCYKEAIRMQGSPSTT